MVRKPVVVATSAFVFVLLPSGTASAGTGVPGGYRVTERVRVGPGVVHETLVRESPREVVHVARIARSARVDLRVVRATPQPQGPRLERTSSMCARVRCLAAINGDFFAPQTGEVIGGVVSGGRPVRSPSSRHHQLTFAADGGISAGVAIWRATLVPTDLQPLPIDGVNIARGHNRLVLYTPEAGRSTATNPHGVEMVASIEEPRAPLRLGRTALVRFSAPRVGRGDTPIPAGGIVLSGHGKGARALQDLWRRVQAKKATARALLRVEADPEAAESLGGAPVLVRKGRRYVGSSGGSFVTGRHPRTAVGWTASRELLLVTVDGRQPGYSIGLSLPELADVMVGLGATDAVNLDGGGSTTFVAGGRVANRPSDRLVRRHGDSYSVHAPGGFDRVLGNLERPVANILAVVPMGSEPVLVDPLRRGIGLARPVDARPGGGLDPGSNPTVALPALVLESPRRSPVPVALAVVLAFAVGSALTAVATRRR